MIDLLVALVCEVVVASPQRQFGVVDVEPAIARDGTVAFVSNRSGAFEIYTVGADGSSLTQLTSGGGKDSPAWSPDGGRIAFVWERDGDADIFLMDRGGANLSQLTSGPAREIHPFWSPDGRRIVFTYYTGDGTANEHLEVRIIDVDGAHERRLTTGSSASYGSLSPNGRHLVYWRDYGSGGDIVVARADGRDERRMTQDPGFEGWPAWSPNGTRVVFSRASGEDTNLFLLEVASGAIQQLTTGPGRRTSPKWSATGEQIYFNGTIGGAQGIWRLDLSEAIVSPPAGPRN